MYLSDHLLIVCHGVHAYRDSKGAVTTDILYMQQTQQSGFDVVTYHIWTCLTWSWLHRGVFPEASSAAAGEILALDLAPPPTQEYHSSPSYE